MPSSTLSDNEPTVLVNVFTVDPTKTDALVELLQEGTRTWISRLPGFISSTLHVARDRTRVVIVGRWREASAIDAMRTSPHMPAYFAQVKAFSTMEAMTCDVVSVTDA